MTVLLHLGKRLFEFQASGLSGLLFDAIYTKGTAPVYTVNFTVEFYLEAFQFRITSFSANFCKSVIVNIQRLVGPFENLSQNHNKYYQ